MKKQKGAALVDYILPTALVGLVFGLAIYSLAESNGILKYLSGSSNMNVDLSKKTGFLGTDAPSSLPKAGDLDGTMENPAVKCVNNVCSIDFGDYILNGIPEDFQEYVQSNGSSGGTDLLATLLEQLSQQLEEQGDSAGAQDFIDLANLAMFMGEIQRNSQDTARQCYPLTVRSLCYQENLYTNYPKNVPESLKDLLPGYQLSETLDLSTGSYLGESRINKENASLFKPDVNPGDAFITKYDSIMANPKYKDGLKGLTSEIMNKINKISFFVESSSESFNKPDRATEVDYYDARNGQLINSEDVTKPIGIKNLVYNSIDFEQELKDSILCATKTPNGCT